MLENELNIYDVWEAPTGNLFVKVSDEYSIAIGTLGNHTPNEFDLNETQYVKANGITQIKKVGRLVFDSGLSADAARELSYEVSMKQMVSVWNKINAEILRGSRSVRVAYLDANMLHKLQIEGYKVEFDWGHGNGTSHIISW